MKKIYNYTQYNLNERNAFLSWIKKGLIDKVSGWSKDFLLWLKKGSIRTIDRGPRKGRPFAMLFLPENGSILEQLRNYMSMRGSEAFENILTETAVALHSSKYSNVGTADLKEHIIDYYNIKLRMAKYYDKPREERSSDDPTKGMKAKPIFIYGAPGIGKTEIVAQCCDDLQVPLLFLDVQFMNPEDFKGIPSVHSIREPKIKNGIIEDPGAGYTRANPPSIFPRDNGSGNRGGIIFMDELNRANTNVLNTMMQFIQQGRIGDEYSLPNKWCLIAAGNRQEDDPNAGISELGTALTSRMTVINYVPNYNPNTGMADNIDEWRAWAEKEMGIMPEIISYLSADPDRIHVNTPQDPKSEGTPFPTHRSWTEASKIFNSKLVLRAEKDPRIKSWRDVDLNWIKSIFEKEIGNTAATQFISYLNVIRSYTEEQLDGILSNADTAIIPQELKNEPSAIFALCALLLNKVKGNELTPTTFPQVFNILKYVKRLEDNNIAGGKGEKYNGVYKKCLNRFEGNAAGTKASMLHTQVKYPDNFKPFVEQRNQLAKWATEYTKKNNA